MGAGSLSLGGTTLPNPQRMDQDWIEKGQRHELASGGVVGDIIALKRVYRLFWPALSQTDRDTIRGRYDELTAQTFDDWLGVTCSVNARLHPLTERQIWMGTVTGVRYEVSMTLEEV